MSSENTAMSIRSSPTCHKRRCRRRLRRQCHCVAQSEVVYVPHNTCACITVTPVPPHPARSCLLFLDHLPDLQYIMTQARRCTAHSAHNSARPNGTTSVQLRCRLEPLTPFRGRFKTPLTFSCPTPMSALSPRNPTPGTGERTPVRLSRE